MLSKLNTNGRFEWYQPLFGFLSKQIQFPCFLFKLVKFTQSFTLDYRINNKESLQSLYSYLSCVDAFHYWKSGFSNLKVKMHHQPHPITPMITCRCAADIRSFRSLVRSLCGRCQAYTEWRNFSEYSDYDDRKVIKSSVYAIYLTKHRTNPLDN